MRLTRCRLRYRGIWNELRYSKSMLRSMRAGISINSWAFCSVEVLWCSGYHICLTRRRSPVRNRAAPEDSFFLSHRTDEIKRRGREKRNKKKKKKKWKKKEITNFLPQLLILNFIPSSWFSWCSGYHVCFTRTRSPVRSRARTFYSKLQRNWK